LIEELSSLDTNVITPLEALNLINHWKKQLKQNTPEQGKGSRQEKKQAKQNENPAAEPSLFDSC